MPYTLQQILDWSEAWATLIPFLTYLALRPKQEWCKPLFYYNVFALVNNTISDIFWKQMRIGIYEFLKEHFPFLYNSDGTFGNIILYNIGSLVRFVILAWFFRELLKQLRIVSVVLSIVFATLFVYLFFINGDIRDFSSPFLATEAALLLVLCLVFYFHMLRDEHSSIKNTPAFWAVTGISIYVVINFPIFLFFNVLAVESNHFAVNIWDIHNLSYIICCIFIAKSFYAAGRPG